MPHPRTSRGQLRSFRPTVVRPISAITQLDIALGIHRLLHPRLLLLQRLLLLPPVPKHEEHVEPHERRAEDKDRRQPEADADGDIEGYDLREAQRHGAQGLEARRGRQDRQQQEHLVHAAADAHEAEGADGRGRRSRGGFCGTGAHDHVQRYGYEADDGRDEADDLKNGLAWDTARTKEWRNIRRARCGNAPSSRT